MSCTHCGKGRVTPTGAVQAAKIQTPETTEVRSWTSLPLLDVTNIPEDLDLIGGSNEEFQSWRVPASIFLGGAINSSRYNVPHYTAIETSQVKPVRFSSSEMGIIPAKAAAGQTAQALAIVSDSEKKVTTLMVSGFYTFSRPHMYEIGKTYYTSGTNEGEVVSVKPSVYSQALFTVIDQLTIAINVELL